jgi:hypothetical protein
MLENGVIDQRLFDWGEELRRHRNIAAHPSDEEMSEEEAQNLFDFAVAMCQYVITLEQKYLEFMDRKKDKQRRSEERDKEVPF